MDNDEIVAELRRISDLLRASTITKQQFNQNSSINSSTVERRFGTWGQALEAAGLIPNPSFVNQRISDEEYLQEIIRLTVELGKKPTTLQLTAIGRFTAKPYQQRWGSWDGACQAAYAKFGYPLETEDVSPAKSSPSISVPPQSKPLKHYQPLKSDNRTRIQYGEPIDFRGLRHAPINEQGVVYIFGMVSRELGFLIESVQTGFPDCEGKRAVDSKQQRWERVLIEFEFKSRNFLLHGHDPEGCDLIVCWIHDWQDCPLEVLELSSQIKFLPTQ